MECKEEETEQLTQEIGFQCLTLYRRRSARRRERTIPVSKTQPVSIGRGDSSALSQCHVDTKSENSFCSTQDYS